MGAWSKRRCSRRATVTGLDTPTWTPLEYAGSTTAALLNRDRESGGNAGARGRAAERVTSRSDRATLNPRERARRRGEGGGHGPKVREARGATHPELNTNRSALRGADRTAAKRATRSFGFKKANAARRAEERWASSRTLEALKAGARNEAVPSEAIDAVVEGLDIAAGAQRRGREGNGSRAPAEERAWTKPRPRGLTIAGRPRPTRIKADRSGSPAAHAGRGAGTRTGWCSTRACRSARRARRGGWTSASRSAWRHIRPCAVLRIENGSPARRPHDEGHRGAVCRARVARRRSSGWPTRTPGSASTSRTA